MSENTQISDRFLILQTGLLSIITLWFLNAYRFIIFENNIIIFVAIGLILMGVSAFIGALLMKWLHPTWLILISTILMLYGHWLLLLPETPLILRNANNIPFEIYLGYHIGTGLVWGNYGIFFVSYICNLYKWKKSTDSDQHNPLILSLINGYLGAFIFEGLLRGYELNFELTTQVILSILVFVCIIGYIFFNPDGKPPLKNQLDWKIRLGTASSTNLPYTRRRYGAALLLFIPLQIMLLLPILYPELLAYQAQIPLDMIKILLNCGLLVGILLGSYFTTRWDTRPKFLSLVLIGNVLGLILFGSYLFVPPGIFNMISFMFISIIVALDLYLFFHTLFQINTHKIEKISAGLYFLAIMSTLGVRLIMIERHMPYIWYFIWLGIVLSAWGVLAFQKQCQKQLLDDRRSAQ